MKTEVQCLLRTMLYQIMTGSNNKPFFVLIQEIMLGYKRSNKAK